MIDYKRIDSIGQEDENDFNPNIETINEAVVWGTDWTTETILNQLLRKNIDLNPSFQRRDAWGNAGKSRFIESLILGLPVPQIILAESKEKRGTYIVIDGKQRLLSIRQFFADINDPDFEYLKLNNVDILTDIKGKTYQDLKSDFQFENYITALENQSIRTTIIKNWPNESFLYLVFLRLNNGSVKLSPQELRQALHPGAFLSFVDEFSINSDVIKIMLNLSKPDARMRDVELVIRFFAFQYFILHYRGNLKNFFDDTVKYLNKEWEIDNRSIQEQSVQLEEAIRLTMQIFGPEAAFSKWLGDRYQNNFNRAIFDIMCYYFADASIRNACQGKFEAILHEFNTLCENDNEFVRSFETSTKNMEPTFKRFSTWGKKLAEILKIPVVVPELKGGDVTMTIY